MTGSIADSKRNVIRPQYRDAKHFLFIATYTFFGFALSQAWKDSDTVKVTIFSMALLVMPGIVLHEFGHAVAAAAVGGQVRCIKLGLTQAPSGPHLPFRFLGFRWELYALPISGSVRYFYPLDASFFRARVVFVNAAGALANLIGAAAATPYVLWGNDSRISALGAGWMIANGIIFLSTIIPYRLIHKGQPQLNDGLNILKNLRLTETEMEQLRFHSKLQRDIPIEKEVLDKLSLNECVARSEAAPERIATLVHLVDKLIEAKDPRQEIYIMKLIDSPQLKPENVAKFLDTYITGHLMEGTINGSTLFDQLSATLVQNTNQSITSKGTRGSVLIDLGCIEEGSTMLKEVLEKTESTIDKTYANIFLALAEKQLGNLVLAREHAQKAAKIDPNCPALKRVSDLLAPP